MKTFRASITLKDGSKAKLVVRIGELTFAYNCGARMLHHAYMEIRQKKKDEWLGLMMDRYVAADKKTIYEKMDEKGVSDWLRDITRGLGFVIITDCVSQDRDTKGLVDYIISRKIGAVMRGPTTLNPVHGGASVITSWIWVPDTTQLVSEIKPKLLGAKVDKNRIRNKVISHYIVAAKENVAKQDKLNGHSTTKRVSKRNKAISAAASC